MEGKIKIGRIFGIPVGLHWTWFLIFALVSWSLATGYFPAEFPALPSAADWILGLVTSLLFFGSVLFHELSHSLLARRYNIPVRDITLFIFGGLSQIEQEPKTSGEEFRIAVAGPLSSFALAAAFGILWLLDRTSPYLAAPSIYLMRINLMLGLFNLIPGFPLDGGRVLQAVAWKITGNFQRATQVAAASGQVVAFGFIGLGIFNMLMGGNFFDGMWLVVIGWFLQNAAGSSLAQANMQQLLRGVKVSQVMSHECALIPGQTPLQQLVEEQVLTGGGRCFFVTDQERLLGVLTLKEVSKVPRAEWSRTTAARAMVPLERTVSVRTEDMLLEALKAMVNANVNQVPVMEGERVAGVLTREHVLHYIRTRAELRV